MNEDFYNFIAYLEKMLKGAKISLTTDKDINDSYIFISPLQKNDKLYAGIKLGAHKGFNIVTVDIGQANHFDVPASYLEDIEGRQYLLKIIKSCIRGAVKEEITKKHGKIIRSKITLDVDNENIKYNYRYGIFHLGGYRSSIQYKPYPNKQTYK